MKTELHSVMAQRNRAWNLKSPLYRLPPEILVEILSLALPGVLPSPRIYMRGLQWFAFVSHQWRLYVNGTPSFWKVAPSEMSLELLQRVLSRSTGLLDVFDSYNRISTNTFVDHVVGHVHRWWSLTISRNGAREWFECLVHLPMPAMEALDLQGTSDTAIVIGEVESLRSVRLVGFCIPWGSKILSGLQSLKLETLGMNSPSTTQLLTILAASPGLVELGFVCLEHRYRDSSDTQTMRVELLMLETLRITSIPQEVTHPLLAALHIPKCTSFNIDYKQRAVAGLSLFDEPTLAHIASSLVAFLRSSTGVLSAGGSPYQRRRERFGSNLT
ncbi:hypothetical protein FRB93_010719 [Tulasnella sp. JGI-2019a]|nr:hypothetical protein FRB93_010719 [Tulasnella sp. JGI-2019a]